MSGALRSLAVVVAVLVCGPASAQRVENMQHLIEHMSKGVSDAQVGDWVTYKVHGGEEGRISFWRVAVVGADKDRHGRDALWMEIELGLHAAMVAPLFQTRLLVAKDASEEPPPITRMFMAWGPEKVQELDEAAMAKMTAPAPPPTSTPGGGKNKTYGVDVHVKVGAEKRLMTLAGTVSSVPTEIRYGTVVIKRIWMSRELPLLHLAKLEMPPIDYTIEIRDYGRDAKPRMILPLDGSPRLTAEGGGPFKTSTLFPAKVNEAIQERRESMERGDAGAH